MEQGPGPLTAVRADPWPSSSSSLTPFRNVATKAFPITLAAGDYELVNQVLDFPPGSGVPQHFHGGPAVVTVLTGELVTADAIGERVLKAGDSLLEGTGDKHSVINKTDGTVRVAVSYLVPKSAQRTTLIK